MKYKIEGDQLPVVICEIEAGEQMITEKGAMAWMTPNIKMETKGRGGIGKSLGRMLSGDSFFQNIYSAQSGRGEIAFVSSFPGSIKAIDVSAEELVVQKSAFLASEKSVKLSVFFKKNLGTGLFGGEGFIMQKLSGFGMAFLEIDGSIVEKNLAMGETIVVDTGHLAYMSASCSMEIMAVKGVKNMVFGGEGVFNTVITGPGKIGLQTIPISNLAKSLIPFLPTSN